jgi:3,4-dihydroxy 2-butanone 4-phosphate synthase/GTP cyclohydrolase II
VEDAVSAAEEQYAGIRLDPIEDAIAAIREGRSVVVVDDEDRENEGDLIFAAQRATPDQVAFMIRWTSGYICVAMQGRELDRLGLPPMTMVNEDRKGTAYAVTVDARDVKATGISAEDRARTIKVLSDTGDGGRRAATCWAYRGNRRSGPAGWTDPRGCSVRADERGRHDDARP